MQVKENVGCNVLRMLGEILGTMPLLGSKKTNMAGRNHLAFLNCCRWSTRGNAAFRCNAFTPWVLREVRIALNNV